jgi:methyl-accepting chemotaxis protein
MKKGNKEKVGIRHSIKTKIALIIATATVLTAAIIIVILLTKLSKDILNTNKNYLSDITLSNGKLMEEIISSPGGGSDVEKWSETYKDVKINGVSSSYAYVIDNNGMLLYHPDASKIWTSVDNPVVSQVVSQVVKGQRPETQVTRYYYQGKWRYAAYYVSQNKSRILVVCADESELLKSTYLMTCTSVSVGILAVIVFSLLGFFTMKICMKPIMKTADTMKKMAGYDFTENKGIGKTLKRKDEAGQMCRAAEVLRNELIKTLRLIQDKSADLLAASQQLSTSAEDTANTISQVENAINDIASGASGQAEDTQTVTENVISMGTMIAEASNEVDELNKNAQSMSVESDSASENMKELVLINNKTKDSIEEIFKQTNATNVSANKIRNAVDIITEIADETNLLSLNASIEAARAGEHGRGFAVVAAQIQKLAEQSSNSANEIRQIIEALIQDSEKAVNTMECVKEIVNEQNDKMTSTDEIFSKVIEGIKQSSISALNIGDKTNQLDTSRGNVIDLVQNLSAIAEENAASTQQTSASTTQVTEIVSDISKNAEQLKAIVKELDGYVKKFSI